MISPDDLTPDILVAAEGTWWLVKGNTKAGNRELQRRLTGRRSDGTRGHRMDHVTATIMARCIEKQTKLIVRTKGAGWGQPYITLT